MDYLWTPWRYQYVATADRGDGCPLCDALAAGNDEQALIIHRGKENFVILNRYPYTSGHVMIVPYVHQGTLPALARSATAEMMDLAQALERALESTYHPQGYNIGMNIGRAAGAGITGHLHMHVLPRWTGDTSFITSVGETRVQPEELSVTYQRLRQALASQIGGLSR
jgi:ATP adenylyltransferase